MPMEWSEGKVAFIQQGEDESPGLFTVHHCAHAMMTWCFSVLTAEQKLPQVELHLSAALPAGLWSYLSNDCIREVELHLTTMRIISSGQTEIFLLFFQMLQCGTNMGQLICLLLSDHGELRCTDTHSICGQCDPGNSRRDNELLSVQKPEWKIYLKWRRWGKEQRNGNSGFSYQMKVCVAKKYWKKLHLF